MSRTEAFTPSETELFQFEKSPSAHGGFSRIQKEAEHDILHEYGPEIEYDRVTNDDLDYCFTQVTMYRRTVAAVANDLNLRPKTLQKAWARYAAYNHIRHDEHDDWFQNDQAIPLMSIDPSIPPINLDEIRALFDECDRV